MGFNSSFKGLIQDAKFEDQLTEVGKAAWKSFNIVTTNGSRCRDKLADTVQSYKAVGCNMSLEVHLLDSHLDFFAAKIWKQWAVSTQNDLPGYLHNGQAIPRQLESSYAGWLLLVT